MATKTDTTLVPASKMEEARAQLDLGNHNEASLLYWEAATIAIDNAAERIGFQLTRRHLYSDVCDLLEPWYSDEHTFRLYSSMLLLRTNGLERYDFDAVWILELVDKVHELFDMLQFAVSKHDE